MKINKLQCIINENPYNRTAYKATNMGIFQNLISKDLTNNKKVVFFIGIKQDCESYKKYFCDRFYSNLNYNIYEI